MAINKNSNVYIILYTVVMVAIVGALLAFLATSLKPRQDENKLQEKKVAIMKAFGNAEANFDESVTVYRLNGTELTEVVKEEQAAIFEELEKRGDLAAATENLPLFKYSDANGAKYVIPMAGKGLWGDIWGYVSVEPKDGNVVITGIVMDHAGETPGLGAEIATDKVQGLFADKQLYNVDGAFAVRMQKGGAKNEYEVDAITGGTKTCDGVNAMLATSIGKYEAFLKAEAGMAVADTELASEEVACQKCATCENRETCEKQCEKPCEECAACEECTTCEECATCEKQCAEASENVEPVKVEEE